MRDFYIRYFQARPGDRYHNPKKDFHSYFLSFESGCRLELMQMPGILEKRIDFRQQHMGLTHMAIAVGTTNGVDELTETLRQDGYLIVGEPRTTGDGYYESVVLDPEGNRIEITA